MPLAALLRAGPRQPSSRTQTGRVPNRLATGRPGSEQAPHPDRPQAGPRQASRQARAGHMQASSRPRGPPGRRQAACRWSPSQALDCPRQARAGPMKAFRRRQVSCRQADRFTGPTAHGLPRRAQGARCTLGRPSAGLQQALAGPAAPGRPRQAPGSHQQGPQPPGRPQTGGPLNRADSTRPVQGPMQTSSPGQPQTFPGSPHEGF